MTSEIVLESGETNEMTVYCFKVEELKSKDLITIVPAQSTTNWGEGINATLIVDLLRITTRFNVDGKINSTDRTKFKAIMEGGGVFTMTYAGTTYNVNFEKSMVTETPSDAGQGVNPSHYTVKFTVIEGVDYGSS